jgi:hypothetical protein
MSRQDTQLNEMVEAMKSACEAMERAELVIAGLRIEADYWKALYEEAVND